MAKKGDKPKYEDFIKTVDPDFRDTSKYNLREAYNELPYAIMKAWQQDPNENHLPDTYKYPDDYWYPGSKGHDTFSNESKYYKPGMRAGRWEGENYIPININPGTSLNRYSVTDATENMAKKKKKYVPSYPGGGDVGNTYYKDITIPFADPTALLEQTSPILQQLFEGMQGEQNAKKSDVFNPMKGFYGFNYAEGGDVSQQPQQDLFNNKPEINYPLASFLPFILEDPRNTVNAGGRKPISIQTEKGEYIASPFGDLVKVAAKKKHKDMDSEEVTDVTSSDNYIVSNHKSMSFKKGQKIKGVGMDSLTLGRSPIYYREGEIATTPKVYKLSDMEPDKAKYTPADVAKRIVKRFPLTNREHDPFATKAQVENKQSRVPYIKGLIALSELKKPTKVPQYAMGGNVGPIDNAIKFNRFEIPNIDDLYRIPEFPYGGDIYDYNDNTKKNRRKQYNSWLDQASDMYQNFFLNDYAQANDATSLVEAGTVLGQKEYKGDNEFLYGNQYMSRLNNLQGSQDRSFGAEQAYYQNAGDRENSVIRQGLGSGYTPQQLGGLRGNAIRNANQGIAGMARDRRQYTDKYGSMRLQATDTYAGRQNQQKAYETDFENNRLQNLGSIATKNIAGRLAAKSGALGAATQFQLAKTPGNALTDTFKAITDIAALAANIGTALSGFGLTGNGNNNGGNQGQQANGSYTYTGPQGPYSQGPQLPWAPNMYGTPYNAFNTPITYPPMDMGDYYN